MEQLQQAAASLTIVDQGTVVASRMDTDQQSCAFPQICVLPSGRWICCYRAAPTKAATTNQRCLFVYSDDQGASWSAPHDAFTPPVLNGAAGNFRTLAMTALSGERVLAALCRTDSSQPSLPYFNETTEGLLDSQIFLAWSEDGGDTWSKPELVDTTPFLCPTPTTGPVLVLASGELALQFELNKTYDDPSPWRHASVLMFSQDSGNSWPDYVLTSSDPQNRIFYWDQRPTVLPSGRILNLFWTFDREQTVYRNIHACHSDDDGRTWSAMWDTGIPGQPAPPVPLADGCLGMVYVDRTAAPLIKMRTSTDGGRSWPNRSEIILGRSATTSQTREKRNMQDAWYEMVNFSIGLPATALLPNGDVLVVYYAGSSTDQTDIRWVRVRAVTSN